MLSAHAFITAITSERADVVFGVGGGVGVAAGVAVVVAVAAGVEAAGDLDEPVLLDELKLSVVTRTSARFPSLPELATK